MVRANPYGEESASSPNKRARGTGFLFPMSCIQKMQFPRQDTGIEKTETKVGIKAKLPKEVYPANRSKQRNPHIADSRSHILKANLSSR